MILSLDIDSIVTTTNPINLINPSNLINPINAHSSKININDHQRIYAMVSPFVESKIKELKNKNIIDMQSPIDRHALSKMKFIGRGSFGIVYKKDYKTAIKISSLLKQAS